MDLSFLLPSNTKDRPPKQFVEKTIQHINQLNLKNWKYEILVYSPDEITGDNVRWIKEESFSDGCIQGYNTLYQHAKGEYLIQAGDDYLFDNNFYTAIDLLKSDIYLRRQLKVLILGTDNGLGSFMPRGYPKYTVFRFPIISKDTVTKYLNGHIFHPQFKNHYADNWLGYWITNMFDETPIEVWNTTIHFNKPTQGILESYGHNDHIDHQTFISLVNRFHMGYRSYV